MTVLRTVDSARATKQWSWNPTLGEWQKVSYTAGAWFVPTEHQVSDLAELVGVLDKVRADPCAFVVRGALSAAAAESVAANPEHRIRRRKHLKNGVEPALVEVPRCWLSTDIDGWPLRISDDLATDPESAIETAIHELLPEAFHNAECWWQLSSSAGFVPGYLKVHLFFWLTEPADNQHIKAVLQQHAPAVDRAFFNAAQPHYIADPIIQGGYDPLPRRTGWRRGLEPAVMLPALKPQAARPHTMPTGKAGGSMAAALAVLGDGDGLDGFHAPLRTATLRYARECALHGDRDDHAIKARLLDAMHKAPRKPERGDLEAYGDVYLQRLIDGAFLLLAGQADLVAPRPHHAPAVHTVAEVRHDTAQAVSKTVADALAWHRLDDEAKALTPPGHSGVLSGVGSGKSRAGHSDIPGFIAAAKEEGLPHRVLWLIDTHKLGSEALVRMAALGINAAVLRGREADLPGSDDPENFVAAGKMCMNLPAVTDAMAIGANIEAAACGSGKPGKPACGWRSGADQCPYQAQKTGVARADVVIASHQSLFHELPKEARSEIGLVIVDEDWWQDGLNDSRDLILEGFAQGPLIYPVLAAGPERGGPPVRNVGATDHLQALSVKVETVFRRTLARENDTDFFVARADVVQAGLTADLCTEAIAWEWQCKRDDLLVPGMPPAVRRERMALGAGNAVIPRRVAVWRAVRDLLTGEDSHTGRLQAGTHSSSEGHVPCITVHSRREIRETLTGLPMVFLDATMPVPVVRHFLPRLKVITDARAAEPHTRVIQVIGGWGKTTLCPNPKAKDDDPENQRRRNTVRLLADYVALHGGARPVVITYEAIEEEFKRPAVRTLHFGAFTGLDSYGDATAVFIIGRPLPKPHDLRNMALALTGRPVPLQDPHTEVRGVQMTDGSVRALAVRAYADETLEALRSAITDSAIVQGPGRGRGVNRTADTPLDIYLMADVVSPLPITHLVRWEDVRPGVLGRMASHGLVLFCPADAHAFYPNLFGRTPESARQAIDRAGGISRTSPYGYFSIGECTGNQMVAVSYKPHGRGQQWRQAHVGESRLATLAEWLTERFCVPVKVHLVPPEQATPSTHEEEVTMELAEQRGLDPTLLCRGPVAWDPPAFLLKLSTGRMIEVPASPRPAPTPWLLEPTSPAPDWLADYKPTGPDDGVVWWGPLRPALPPELQRLAFEPLDPAHDAAVT